MNIRSLDKRKKKNDKDHGDNNDINRSKTPQPQIKDHATSVWQLSGKSKNSSEPGAERSGLERNRLEPGRVRTHDRLFSDSKDPENKKID